MLWFKSVLLNLFCGDLNAKRKYTVERRFDDPIFCTDFIASRKNELNPRQFKFNPLS